MEEAGKYLERTFPHFFLGIDDEEKIEQTFLKASPALLWWHFLTLKVTNSNANESGRFSDDAWVGVEPTDRDTSSNKLMGIPLTDFFPAPFKKFAKIKWDKLEKTLKAAIENLKQYHETYETEHKPCMMKLFGEDKLEEEIVQSVLAFHYFGPLVASKADLFVDQYTYKGNGCSYCSKYPVQNVKRGRTEFGNNAVWHGRADIVITEKLKKNTSIVSLVPTCLTDTGGCEPVLKKGKFDPHLAEENLEHKRKIISTLDFDTLMKEINLKNQVLSQTIANAFLSCSFNKDMEEKYVPCFLVSSRFVLVSMYNKKNDLLVCQGSNFEICNRDGSLISTSLFAVWFFLNLDLFDHNISLTDFKACGFQKSLSKDILEIYKNGMSLWSKGQEVGPFAPPMIVTRDLCKSLDILKRASVNV